MMKSGSPSIDHEVIIFIIRVPAASPMSLCEHVPSTFLPQNTVYICFLVRGPLMIDQDYLLIKQGYRVFLVTYFVVFLVQRWMRAQ
jgi:hypothetical protein